MWRGSDKYLQVVGHFRSLVIRVHVLLSVLLLRFSQIVVTFKHDIISSSHFTFYVDWFRLLPPATKLGQGYTFTGVCHFVIRGVASSRGVHGPGGVCMVPGVCVHGLGGAWYRGKHGTGGKHGPGVVHGDPPRTATVAGGTHPTGMHSCVVWSLVAHKSYFIGLKLGGFWQII